MDFTLRWPAGYLGQWAQMTLPRRYVDDLSFLGPLGYSPLPRILSSTTLILFALEPAFQDPYTGSNCCCICLRERRRRLYSSQAKPVKMKTI